MRRYLEYLIKNDLSNRMVFISGPRQVGKTTLSKNIGTYLFAEKYEYLNWDNIIDRKKILNTTFEADKKLIIFDEIHKYNKWKNYIKGEYDNYKDKFNIIVTGSARLDIYKKGGDSLLGRYRNYRLHPFSLSELLNETIKTTKPFDELLFSTANNRKAFEILLKYGGFPEVFLNQSEKFLRRWHNERLDRIIKEDIRDIETIRDLSALQVLAQILPDKIGSIFSINSIREDLQVTHKTVSLWIDILEKFYYHYRIYPFQSNKIKSLRKESKMYLWDWSELTDEYVKFENIIASHLLKFCHFLNDAEGYKTELYFLRDREQREVDFLVTVDNKPWFCVEAKYKYKTVPSQLKYFRDKLEIPFSYIVTNDNNLDIVKDNVRVMSIDKFLSGLV
jgi:hypothetical protein